MIARLRHYRFDWKLSILLAMLLPLLTSLGLWQLQREQEKLALQEVYASRQQQTPVALVGLDSAADLQYRQVTLEGEADNTQVFLLDNRIHQGRAGFEVLQALHTAQGQVVFINRGWLAQGPTRTQLPVITPLTGRVQLQGSVYVPVGTAFTLGADTETPDWPKVIQQLDPPRMARLAGLDPTQVFPYTVRLAATSPGVLVRDWPVVSTTGEKHRAYAVQWFAMALALIALYLYYSTRPPGEGND